MNNKEVIYINVNNILPNRFQPRVAFDEKEIEELSASIKEHGILQPILLRKLAEDNYEIVAGERRYKAALLAGMKEVPTIVLSITDDESAEIAIVENIQRKNLTSIEEAWSYKKLLDRGRTQDEIAKKLGISQSAIANKLRLISLTDEVKEALLRNRISERHARSLLKINDEKIQIDLLNRIINEKLTVRQTDEEIDKILGRDINFEVQTPIFPTFDELNLKPQEEKNEEKLVDDIIEVIEEEKLEPFSNEIENFEIEVLGKHDTYKEIKNYIKALQLEYNDIKVEEKEEDNKYQIIINIDK